MTREPPKPRSRAGRVSLWRYLRLFRADILSAQPERLYGARMAEFRTPFFRSYLVNEPDLIRDVLSARPLDFPKSERIGEGLRPLLGRSVFLTNGAVWQRQRRIIDPAFEGGRLRDTFPAMLAAGRAAADRLHPGVVEVEAATSHAAADVIFRTLFSLPIEDETASRVFARFRAHQRAQPILNLAAFVPLPRWMPRFHSRRTRRTARDIRGLIAGLAEDRQRRIAAGTAPDDLATKIMTTRDPETGETFSTAEMVDQVAIFFLAGHETSASALAWALYLVATHPEAQDRVAAEAVAFMADPRFSGLSELRFTRDVFRETLRLYPPVPMMVRETMQPERFRNREVPRGAQVVVSPWHMHRNPRVWTRPDAFDPERWRDPELKACPRETYLPFSQGARVCPGAGFAMAEGPLLLACLLSRWHVAPVEGQVPVPVAHLTVRARDGIRLRLSPR
ncbi:cytochrome P450 [Tranquillimonas rosea]|uniref:cytochrome P450 n=1 Tax=Tranquillimonas rosea TaxID=641238 RepID=UPI003BACE1D2